MSPTARIDPFLAGNFRVAIDGISASSFSEVSGLDVSLDVVDYRAGNDSQNGVEKLPGLNKYSNVTLKRGLTSDLSLWTWTQNVLKGTSDRRAVQITLLDQSDTPVLIWTLTNAWPCKWSGPVLAAMSSEVAIEALELSHEGLALTGV